MVKDTVSLGIMLVGEHVRVINNFLGDAFSDIVELLGGPGEIRGNFVEIQERSGYVLGTDDANDIRITNNTVRVLNGAYISEAVFRTWRSRYRNIISENIVTVESGGRVRKVLETAGYNNVVSNNIFTALGERMQAEIQSGSLVHGNYFTGVDIRVLAASDWPVLFSNNVMSRSTFQSNARVLLANNLLIGTERVGYEIRLKEAELGD